MKLLPMLTVVKKLDINTLNLYTRRCIELKLESIAVSEPRSAPSAANVRFADLAILIGRYK
jgi:hypothetical protein